MPLNFISATWQLLEIQWGLLVFYSAGTPWGTLQYIRRRTGRTAESWWCSDSPLAVFCYYTLVNARKHTHLSSQSFRAVTGHLLARSRNTSYNRFSLSLSSCMTARSSNDSRNNMHLSTSLSSFVTLSSEFWCCSSLSVAPRWRNSVMVDSIC